MISSIASSSDFVDLCALFGYYAEEHVLQTGDGYLLGLHRLCWKNGEESLRVNSGGESVNKRVVYLHHGLLMSSEVWVCLTQKERCLPFMLVEKGYDVWVSQFVTDAFITRVAKEISLGTTGAISIPKSQLGFPRRPTSFGTFLLTNSLFTTSQTALITYSPRLLSCRSPTSAFHRAPLRPLQHCQFIPP